MLVINSMVYLKKSSLLPKYFRLTNRLFHLLLFAYVHHLRCLVVVHIISQFLRISLASAQTEVEKLITGNDCFYQWGFLAAKRDLESPQHKLAIIDEAAKKHEEVWQFLFQMKPVPFCVGELVSCTFAFTYTLCTTNQMHYCVTLKTFSSTVLQSMELW